MTIKVVTKELKEVIVTSSKNQEAHIENGTVDCKIHHLPPTTSNPSALDGAKENMRHLARLLGLRGFVPPEKEQRNNLIFFEDGGGYIPSKKAIENTFVDPACSQCFDSKETFLEHFLSCHPEEPLENFSAYREFRDIKVELGGGHLELNFRRNILSDALTYNAFVKPTMMSAGFSEIQARYQATSRDNHK